MFVLVEKKFGMYMVLLIFNTIPPGNNCRKNVKSASMKYTFCRIFVHNKFIKKCTNIEWSIYIFIREGDEDGWGDWMTVYQIVR